MSAQPTEQTDTDPGLYGPDSVTWRVQSDPSMLLAGFRALLLQTVHPLAMHGLQQNSAFETDPWGRFIRTAEYVAVTTYGTTREAERAGAKLRGIHRRLRGVDPDTGQTFRVDDPDLLLWVHCTEVESFLSTAVRCGLRLSAQEQDRYYTEQLRSAALVGLEAWRVPSDVAAMADYFRDVQRDLRTSEAARRGVAFGFWPPMPVSVQLLTPARPAWVSVVAVSAAMLPRWCRRLYALPGLPTTDVAATLAGRAIRRTLLTLPDSLTAGPELKAARTRVGVT